MSAALEPEPTPLEPRLREPSQTAMRVEAVVRQLPAVGLDRLDSWAALMTRVDRKYVVPVATLERLVALLDDDWHALEVDGRRLSGYTSTYFDTADLATYRAHVQGRRRRYKVRVRQYVDTDSCMLEVKRKGLRGVTVKERTLHPDWRAHDLGEDGRAFVEESLRGYATLPDADLGPVVTTSNRRATLVHPGSPARLTIDSDLSAGWGERVRLLRDGLVLLESKAEGRSSPVDPLLRRLGERPVEVSKFCVGVAASACDVRVNPWRRTLHRYFETPAS